VRSVKSVKSAVRARAISAARSAAKPGLRGLVRPLLTRQPSAPPEQVLYRICKSGWAVIVEKTPNAQGTRFVCPFCTVSHRVPGPMRGFKKMRRAPWVKLRRVEE
jgi:hypothetical protein